MTDLFSINAIQTHFSQFTLQKRGKGQMLTEGKENREGNIDVSIRSRSPLKHEEISSIPSLLGIPENPKEIRKGNYF